MVTMALVWGSSRMRSAARPGDVSRIENGWSQDIASGRMPGRRSVTRGSICENSCEARA